MRKPTFTRPMTRLLLGALLLNLTLFLTACGGASGASATTMHLKKAEGTVGVADGAGNEVALAENLNLYSGYPVATEAESYAWIDLDAVKLAKMDAESAVEVVKDGKQLTVNVQTGSLFFNVSEPLADDETMEIATSSMLVGIRGTCGWVTQNTAALLEGTVTVTAGKQTVTVNAGEMAVRTENGALEVKPFSAAFVPAFVQTEVVKNEQLAAQVLEAAGMDLTEDPTAFYVEWLLAHDLDEVLYSEWIDFAGDGTPELLVFGIQNSEVYSNDAVWLGFYIFTPIHERGIHYITDALNLLPEMTPYNSKYVSQETSWSLVEADGRLFLEIYGEFFNTDPEQRLTQTHAAFASYYGIDAEGNSFREDIYYSEDDNGISDVNNGHSVAYGSDRERWDCDPDDFAATRAKYRLVKQLLYSPDHVTVIVTAP